MTALLTTDAQQDRQYSPLYGYQNVLTFASTHPGKLYIFGDEPDHAYEAVNCITPADYALMYHTFVSELLNADATARVSPAGFTEPGTVDACTNGHDTTYAQAFYDAYKNQNQGAAPPVTEWRFHDFANSFATGYVASWYSQVSSLADWSVRHGANMVLGSWGFLGWNESICDFQSDMEKAMNLLYNDSRINAAIWWSYEPWGGYNHYLSAGGSLLTPEGLAYSNPIITASPSNVSTVGFSFGRAKIQWANTNTQLQIQAEFWRQPVGGSFAADHSDFVAAGGTATPLDQFTVGDRIKGRAGYYNPVGICGPWSAFSNTILLH